MKHLLIVLFVTFSACSFAQIKKVDFKSQKLNETREIYISLPASYEKNKTKQYPLLVLLDGDYLLNPFVSALNHGAYWDELPEVIVVAVNQNGQRNTDCAVDQITGMPDGKSIDFFDFISLEIIPMVQKEYRTTNFKIIAGHDTTAAFLNFFLYQEKPLFNAYISLSPELPVNMEDRLPEIMASSKLPLFYYLSSAEGDEQNMKQIIKKLDTDISTITNLDLNYKFDFFNQASHYSLILHSIPSALYHIFADLQPISVHEYDTKIAPLKEGYVEYLKKKYDLIENSFGIKNPIRINDFKAIEAAILANKDYNELDALAILADKNYPKSMLGDYELAIMFENKGDNQRAVRYYMSGFNKEEIADLTKDMMFAKAEELKKTYAKKPKIKGKPGQDTNTDTQPVSDEPASDSPVTEEEKQ